MHQAADQKYQTREEWLIAAAETLAQRIAAAEAKMPEHVRYTCGWPSKGALAAKKRVIGQCWSALCSKDARFEIFISPYLDDQVEVLATLLHEMIHAAVGIPAGHRGPFKRVAVKTGLEGPMTATHAGPELEHDLKDLAAELGRYPHGKLDKAMTDGSKKEGTRMLKIVCPECGYTARTTAKWIEAGLPTCCCGTKMETV